MDPRRPPSPGTVATILLLRRRAEHVALQDLLAVRKQIERWRQAQAQAQAALWQAEQVLRQLRQGGPPPLAGALAQAHQALGSQLGVVRTLAARHAAAAAQIGQLVAQADSLRARLGMAMSRREAAELHEARDRRERSVRRARQEASLEQEAVDREARSAAVIFREARSAAVIFREARSAAVIFREARSAGVINRRARWRSHG